MLAALRSRSRVKKEVHRQISKAKGPQGHGSQWSIAGRELPGRAAAGGALSATEWTINPVSATDAVTVTPAGIPGIAAKSSTQAYRCVFSPTG